MLNARFNILAWVAFAVLVLFNIGFSSPYLIIVQEPTGERWTKTVPNLGTYLNDTLYNFDSPMSNGFFTSNWIDVEGPTAKRFTYIDTYFRTYPRKIYYNQELFTPSWIDVEESTTEKWINIIPNLLFRTYQHDILYVPVCPMNKSFYNTFNLTNVEEPTPKRWTKIIGGWIISRINQRDRGYNSRCPISNLRGPTAAKATNIISTSRTCQHIMLYDSDCPMSNVYNKNTIALNWAISICLRAFPQLLCWIAIIIGNGNNKNAVCGYAPEVLRFCLLLFKAAEGLHWMPTELSYLLIETGIYVLLALVLLKGLDYLMWCYLVRFDPIGLSEMYSLMKCYHPECDKRH